MTRRTMLASTSAACFGWLTGAAERLAAAAQKAPRGDRPSSIILLWLGGGPSQLETFDPHEGAKIAGGTRAIKTSASGVQIADNLPQLAEQMHSVSIIRSMTSREADHLRGSYVGRTGYSPESSIVHPSVGAVCCHQLKDSKGDLPRHISILPSFPYVPAVALRPFRPGRGGLLGSDYDAFCIGDPASPLPSIKAPVSSDRQDLRFRDAALVDRHFLAGRPDAADEANHLRLMNQARRFMSSEQLDAFNVLKESQSTLQEYGDNHFGRGCLAARRLIEAGVRCVEVVLEDWDSHANNHEIQRGLCSILDPAFAALIKDLRSRDLLEKTIILCAGEFGRSPEINGLGGRDHWNKGFSVAVAGGGLRTGVAIGQTDPQGSGQVRDPWRFNDLYATVYTALGINPAHEIIAPNDRPIKLSDGKPIVSLLG